MKTKILIMAAALLVLLPLTALAAVNPADVKKAESYLQSLGTMQADFVQTAYDGSQVTGTFYLDRPGKLRFEYNEIDDFIVADGTFIYYYDSEMKQQSNAPISSSLADFLLRKHISLSGDVTVTDVRRTDGQLNMTLTMSDDPGAGALTLGFLERANGSIVLQNWQVRDSQNLTTAVSLSNIKTGVRFKRGLFYFLDPERFGRPTR